METLVNAGLFIMVFIVTYQMIDMVVKHVSN